MRLLKSFNFKFHRQLILALHFSGNQTVKAAEEGVAGALPTVICEMLSLLWNCIYMTTIQREVLSLRIKQRPLKCRIIFLSFQWQYFAYHTEDSFRCNIVHAYVWCACRIYAKINAFFGEEKLDLTFSLTLWHGCSSMIISDYESETVVTRVHRVVRKIGWVETILGGYVREAWRSVVTGLEMLLNGLVIR